MRKILGVAAALCLLGIGATEAESVRGTLEAAKFFGTWAPNCQRPASPTNPVRKVFVTADGQVRFTESLGESFEPNVYVVLDAALKGSRQLMLSVELNDGIRQDLTISRSAGRLRTMANRRKASPLCCVRSKAFRHSARRQSRMTRRFAIACGCWLPLMKAWAMF